MASSSAPAGHTSACTVTHSPATSPPRIVISKPHAGHATLKGLQQLTMARRYRRGHPL